MDVHVTCANSRQQCRHPCLSVLYYPPCRHPASACRLQSLQVLTNLDRVPSSSLPIHYAESIQHERLPDSPQTAQAPSTCSHPAATTTLNAFCVDLSHTEPQPTVFPLCRCSCSAGVAAVSLYTQAFTITHATASSSTVQLRP